MQFLLVHLSLLTLIHHHDDNENNFDTDNDKDDNECNWWSSSDVFSRFSKFSKDRLQLNASSKFRSIDKTERTKFQNY